MVLRPRVANGDTSSRGRRGLRLAAVAGLAAIAGWNGLEAFTAAPPQLRPAGGFTVVEELPRGLVCRAAYGDQQREEWSPIPQWRGEKTYHPSRDLQADEHRQWYHLDAEGKVLGHFAQAVAALLRGKDSPLYDPTRDVGAFVVVTNCEKIRVTGKKYHYKLYFRNLSFKPGHLKVERFKDLQKRFPERIIMRAVWGSMPSTPSCRRIFKERLKLFSGPNHLYYEKDPVEYPMHTIRDCTPDLNLRKRDRARVWAANRPKVLEIEKREEAEANKLLLSDYKAFLANQFSTEGDEAAERLELDELAYKAERSRMAKVVKENEGKPTTKQAIRMYLGTELPRKRVSGNQGSRIGSRKWR